MALKILLPANIRLLLANIILLFSSGFCFVRELKDILPIFGVVPDCILSKQGDVTSLYEVTLPELFTMIDNEYKALHQSLIRAIKILPAAKVFHKQDWFTEGTVAADFSAIGVSFLSSVLDKGLEVQSKLDEPYYTVDPKKKRKVIGSIFPEKIIFDGINFRTARMNKVFQLV